LITDVLCAGDTTGSIAVNVENATPPVTYLWSNGKATSTIEHLGAGPYTVTIGDAAGCGEIREYTVSQPSAIQIEVDTVVNIVGVTPGIVLITVTGGVSPYTYLWTAPNGGTNTNEDQLSIAQSGNFTVVVTDANGCTASMDSIFVGMEVGVKPEPKFTPLKIYPVPAIDELHIDLDVPVTEVIISGIDGRTVLQDNNVQQNILDVSRLDSGWYVLRISDGHRWYIARMVK
jgi:hypothetical protein